MNLDTRRSAGILSPAGEGRRCVVNTQPKHIAFDLKRLMRTQYKVRSYQALRARPSTAAEVDPSVALADEQTFI